jgi:hypothetical protein
MVEMSDASETDAFDRPEFAATREALHRVAVHVVARARRQATGRFSLRASTGGLSTPEFGSDGRRVRLSGGTIVVESDAPGNASAVARYVDGASLADLATFAGVDLAEPFDVGHDTPDLGDIDAPLSVDSEAAASLASWYADVSAALDRVVAEITPERSATLPRLWPEHFDLAIEVDARPERRVNLGGSPGDGFCPEPYLYVGPWTAHRPGEAEFWNAPFGAYRTASSLGSGRIERGASFLLTGIERLAAD